MCSPSPLVSPIVTAPWDRDMNPMLVMDVISTRWWIISRVYCSCWDKMQDKARNSRQSSQPFIFHGIISHINSSNIMGFANPPPYTPFQHGDVCTLAPAGGGVITALGMEARIRPWERSETQKWRIEEYDERCGFRNLSTGRLLSLHIFGNLSASVYELNDWELFILESVEDGFRFKVTNYWVQGQGVLVRPSLGDYLQFSGQSTRYSPTNLTHVD